MSMEHKETGEFESKFQNPALALGLHNDIGKLAGGQAGTGGIVMEEVGMQVKRVNQVKLEHIDQINPHLFPGFERNRIFLIMKYMPMYYYLRI